MTMDGLIDRLKADVRPGDAVLSGGLDPVSLAIQMGTGTPFSHVGVVTEHDRLVEAYDYALTPIEDDEGIYRTSIRRFLTRCGTTCRLRVMRPDSVDQGALRAVADHMVEHSPAFPSTGMGFLALCGLSVPLLKRLPESLRRRITIRQTRWTADGTTTLHCAEAATRLYTAAGVTIVFQRPTLAHHLRYHVLYHPESRILPISIAPRSARPGVWPNRYGPAALVRGTRYAVSSSIEAVVARMDNIHQYDAADLIMPGDFSAADPFVRFAEFHRRGNEWIEVA